MGTIEVTHNAGFFSCCTFRLESIIYYYNQMKVLPKKVNSSTQFSWYKTNIPQEKDITFDYFENYENIEKHINTHEFINYYNYKQFEDYNQLNYTLITPFIEKYFSPSKEIRNIINEIETQYQLDYDNICVLFYRGNDKNTETPVCDYEEYFVYIEKILEKNPNIQFLIQSDETEFIELMTNKFPENSFYFKDKIRHINKSNTTVDNVMSNKNYLFSKYYLAITIIMSKCKYIICGSGNCSIWIMFYRGNTKNVFQSCNGVDNHKTWKKWIEPNVFE